MVCVCGGGKRYVKNVCMYAALFRLSFGIVTQTARRKARRRHRGESVPYRHPPDHKDATIHSHMTNHAFENPKPVYVRKHPLTGGVSTLARPRKYQKVAPKSGL